MMQAGEGMSIMAMPKVKPPMEVTIEKEEPDKLLYCQWAPVLFLRVGSHFIEVTSTYLSPNSEWTENTLRLQRGLHRHGRPLLVGLCTFKDPPREKLSRYRARSSDINLPFNPYRVICICLGGSHVLFYRLNYIDDYSFKHLRDLLEHKKAVVVGLGVKEIADGLFYQSSIKRPVDLRDLVARARGKDVVKNGLGIVEMAELVLDGIRLEKMPARVSESYWGRESHWEEEYREMELIKFAARDAFLSYQIAAKCIQSAGLPSHAETS